ncbi:ABC transporter transmembrane domain-containing protein [Actinokineospora terrae]|uniref:ABC transporter transmembrane region n=1 Tax=Actinokineospora terrae TaxID=155974 RepID=A0A1H9X7A1_9PSEU|nr:ABC transporter ATP-binding protein [Actinokineospora terrae]SES42010.1 ABC transporter transmembrane region [Actinokineospora terrae]
MAATLVVLAAVTAVLGALFTGLARRATITLAARIAADLREAVVERVLGLDTSVAQSAGSGDVASRVTEDMEIFAAAVPLISDVFSAAATVAVSFAAFGSLDWRLALAFVVVFPVYALILRWYLPRAGAGYGTGWCTTPPPRSAPSRQPPCCSTACSNHWAPCSAPPMNCNARAPPWPASPESPACRPGRPRQSVLLLGG